MIGRDNDNSFAKVRLRKISTNVWVISRAEERSVKTRTDVP